MSRKVEDWTVLDNRSIKLNLFRPTHLPAPALSCGGVASGSKPINRLKMRPSRAMMKLCGIEVRPCMSVCATSRVRPTDVVIDFIFTHKVRHHLRRRIGIFSGESQSSPHRGSETPCEVLPAQEFPSGMDHTTWPID